MGENADDIERRRERLAVSSVANSKLVEAIAEKCLGCDEAQMRAFVLADRVGRGTMTIDQAEASLSRDTDACKGTIERTDVYDAHPICWRKQQLGREGILRGEQAFRD